jgi:hypothetical protein
MTEEDTQRAWLCIAAGEDLQYGGNDGYPDEVGIDYHWDETVPNSKRVNVGDAIVLWDKSQLLGISIIESIETFRADKLIRRCAVCNGSRIKPRKLETPKYRCNDCRMPVEVNSSTYEVTAFKADYAAGWTDLHGRLTGEQLRLLCHAPRSQHSIRSLDLERFEREIGATSTGPQPPWLRRSRWGSADGAANGHYRTTVRARRGQARFRDSLLREYGPVCALSGRCPQEALDAAHLYSYAEVGVHHDDGGLLLRRDLHRLFDLGMITVEPTSLTISVSPRLQDFPQYADLAGMTLQTKPVTRRQRTWLRLHWMQHSEQVAPTS